MNFDLQTMQTVTSTNDLIKAAIKDGAPEGLAIFALEQTNGYGRQGRMWSSPVGGMYLSVLLRPNVPVEQLSTLSLAVAVAVRRALAEIVAQCVSAAPVASTSSSAFAILAPATPTATITPAAPAPAAPDNILLKWPNDIVYTNTTPFNKLCGISLECISNAVCVGIGVNVFPPEGGRKIDPQTGTGNIPVYLADISEVSSPEYTCTIVLEQLAVIYTSWLKSGLAPFLQEYETYAALRGASVAIQNSSGAVTAQGTVAGINKQGNLLLRGTDGREIAISSGEAHVKVVE